jgi:hypothetical protein
MCTDTHLFRTDGYIDQTVLPPPRVAACVLCPCDDAAVPAGLTIIILDSLCSVPAGLTIIILDSLCSDRVTQFCAHRLLCCGYASAR